MTGGVWRAERIAHTDVPGCLLVVPAPTGGAVAVFGTEGLALHDPLGTKLWTVPRRGVDLPEEADLVWSPDGDRLYLLADRRLTCHDAVTGIERALPRQAGRLTDATAVAVSTDGRTVAVGTRSGLVLLLGSRDGLARTLAEDDAPVSALAWRPGMDELCVAWRTQLHFWDVGGSALMRSLDTGRLYPRRVAWSPEAGLLAVAGLRELRLVDVRNQHERAGLGLSAPPRSIAFSRDGSVLLVAGAAAPIRLVSRDLQEIGGIEPDCARLAVSADGVLGSCETGGRAAVWRLPDTVQAPAARVDAAVRQWAERMAHTVGFAPADTGTVPAVHPRAVPGSEDALCAWAADAGSYYLAEPGGRLRRVEAGSGRTVWSVASGVGGQAVTGGQAATGIAVSADPAGLVAVCWRARTGGRGIIRIHDCVDGRLVADHPGAAPLAWAPGPSGRVGTLAFLEDGPAPKRVIVLRAPGHGSPAGTHAAEAERAFARPTVLSVLSGVDAIAWTPDGERLTAATPGGLVFWDTGNWRRVADPGSERVRAHRIAWSPDGRKLAAADGRPHGPVQIWTGESWTVHRNLGRCGRGAAPAWSPDGRLLAHPADHDPEVVELWDVVSGRLIRSLAPEGPRGAVGGAGAGGAGGSAIHALEWAPDGGSLVTSGTGRTVVRWHLFDRPAPRRPGSAPDDSDSRSNPQSASARRVALLRLGTAVAAAGVAVPLILPADLVALIEGEPPDRLRALADHRGVSTLRSLGWPRAANAGIAVLLAAELPPDQRYAPIQNASADAHREALHAALDGIEVAPNAPDPPLPELTSVLGAVDESLLTLLSVLGPHAVAADPSLPARLRGARDSMLALAPRQRRLLEVRMPLWPEGQAQGSGPSSTRAGFTRHGRLTQLPSTQLALPPAILAFRLAGGNAVFHARQGALPPAPRSTVIVLDDTPAAFGAVGVTLRLVAHLTANALLRAGLRCALVTLGEPSMRLLARRADLLHVWTAASLRPPQVDEALRLAKSAAARLSGLADTTAQTIVLTHPFLDVPREHAARTLRVRYPGGSFTDRAAPPALQLDPDPAADAVYAAVAALLDASSDPRQRAAGHA